MINESLSSLQFYIEKNNFNGYDPYDALKSPFFKLPILKTNKILRFLIQQLVKRLPFSVRGLLLVPKGCNPVTLGLSIQAYAYLIKHNPEKKIRNLKKINNLIDELIKMIPKGFSGACWGYDFDWEARNAKIPAYQPTIVATGIITNALFVTYKITGNIRCAKLLENAVNFVINDLNRTYQNDSFCFSYSPHDNQQVFNASMKGVRLLAQAYHINGNRDYLRLAKQAVSFIVSKQNKNGSWAYSLAKAGGWSDNYHTGYILDCLDEYQNLTGDKSWVDNIKLGYEFYINNFIEDEIKPKFYDNQTYPIDCTSAAQTILTTLRFGDKKIARNVAEYMIQKMQKKNGSFMFRKFRYYIIKTSFMRWSNAWMFVSLSNLVYESKI
tara:strand:+ start:4084 stop:5229 length:1146 start_codon:yes stop_codon:yes gene_type:complete